MNAPDWKKCTEEQLWKYVAYHLAKGGIECVLVGGAVVAIYSEGAYHSGDLDLIAERYELPRVMQILNALGFEKVHGRHFEHPDCSHLIIEFPPGPISIGDDRNIVPDILRVDGQRLRIFSPTDCIRDRLASYIHFNARECLEQAVLVANNQPFNLKKVEQWCSSEGAEDKFLEFKKRIRKPI